MNYTKTIAIPKLFIGMDVHKKSWIVHFNTDLFDNKTVTMPADRGALVSYVEKHFPAREVTCCCRCWCLCRWLSAGNHQQHNIRLVPISSHSLPYLLLVVGVANPALPTAQNTQQRLALGFGLMNEYQQRQKKLKLQGHAPLAPNPC